MQTQDKAVAPGIIERPSKRGGKPSYLASVFDRRTGTKRRKTFATLSAAKAWRKDAQAILRAAPEKMPLHDTRTLAAVVEEWLKGIETGAVLSRRGLRYDAETLAGYRRALEKYVLPELGRRKFTDIEAHDVQTLVGQLNVSGLSGRTIRNVLVPLAALYRHHRHTVRLNPVHDLDLPKPRIKRRRVVSPEAGRALLEALPAGVREVYAAALYAGLRRAELRALRWEDVRANTLVVSRAFDDVSKEIVPLKWKDDGEERVVPLIEPLRAELAKIERRPDGFVFGQFTPNTVRRQAQRAWATAAVCAFFRRELPGGIEVEALDLHECRHTFSTWLDASGVSQSRADRYMGHAKQDVSEMYRHLTPEVLADDATRLEAYLGAERAEVVSIAR